MTMDQNKISFTKANSIVQQLLDQSQYYLQLTEQAELTCMLQHGTDSYVMHT